MSNTINRTDLIQQYIEQNPHKTGAAEARLVESGISVWALIGYYEAVGRDAATVAHDYHIPIEAVQAALAYYEAHPVEIAVRLAENAA